MQTHLKRNLLARAVALALLGGTTLPMAGYAATIQGQVFMDANNNGSFDTCEAPYSDTVVFIAYNSGEGGFFTPRGGTDGQYQSIAHDPGSYTIWTGIPEEYWQTTPATGAGFVPYDFDIASANDTITVNFGFYNPNAAANTAPVVTVPATAITVNVGNEVNFSATMQDAEGDTACAVSWTFGDGTTAEGMNATHIYGQVGTYTAVITVTDARGAVGTAQVTVTVENNPPVIEDITAEPTPVPVCEAVSLTSRITDNPGDTITATWQLGDDNTGEGQSITHTYAVPGTYDVTLTAMDNYGASSSDTITITVNNTLPVAEAGNNVEVEVNTAVNFNGSFTDADACDAHAIHWDFGDGSSTNTLNPTHSYTQPGIYVAILTVTDKFGAQSTDIITVTVKNTPPVIEAISATPDTVQICEAISFSGQATDTPNDVLTYGWTFGDGNTAAGQNVTHTYAEPGNYTATFNVTDSFDVADSAIVAVTVNNTLPTVEAGDDQETSVNTEISFNGSFEDADSCDTHTISWDFGDGNTVTDTLTPTHTYAEKGTYTVTLTVTDKFGGVNTDTLTVTVAGLPPVVAFAEESIVLDAAEAFDYAATITDPDGDDGPYTVELIFGEGGNITTDNVTDEIGADPYAYSRNYAFNESGEFTVTINVTGAEGTGSDTMMVTVRGIDTDPCTEGVATVSSQMVWGSWLHPNTWSTGKVPGKDDWVRIQADHRVVLPDDLSPTNRLKLKGLCIEAGATLQSAYNILGLPPTWTSLHPAVLNNQGTIEGYNGVDAGMDGPNYLAATASSAIRLMSPKLTNDGLIISRPAGADRAYKFLPHKKEWNTQGGKGGLVEVYAKLLANNGQIEGGQGGHAYNNGYTAAHGEEGYYTEGHDAKYVVGTTRGGDGGDVRVVPTDIAASTNTGTLKAGCGGNAFGMRHASSPTEEERTYEGKGGDVITTVGTNAGIIEGCAGSLAWWDPTTLKAAGASVIRGSDRVTVFGGRNWTMDMTDLGPTGTGVIAAADSIEIAVGENGIIDLPPADRGVVFRSKKVILRTDNIRMGGQPVDKEKALAKLKPLVQADVIELKPHKILYHAQLSTPEHLVGEPGETVSVNLTLINSGPVKDSYKLSVTNPEGWEVSALPETVNVNSLRHGELSFDVKLPTTRGLENTLTVTAISKGNKTVQAVAKVRVGVIRAERFDGRNGKMADISLVLDTNMMTGELHTIADAIETLWDAEGRKQAPSKNAITGQTLKNMLDEELMEALRDIAVPAVIMPTVELITFADMPKTRVVTRNFGDIIGRIRSIRPANSSTCSSMSVDAIEYALENLDPNGSKQIILATASRLGKDAAATIAKAQGQGVKVHIISTGILCGDEAAEKAVYEEIVESTGGILGWMSKAEASVETVQGTISDLVNKTMSGGDAAEPTPCQNCQTFGEVKDVDGDPIAGAVVQVKDKATGEVVAKTTTDVNGDWTVILPEEGEHIVSISKDKYAFPEVLVEVGDGQPAEIVIGPDAKIKPSSALAMKFRPIGVGYNKMLLGEEKTYEVIVTNGDDEEATGIILYPLPHLKLELTDLRVMEEGPCSNIRCELAAIVSPTHHFCNDRYCKLPNLQPNEFVKVQFTARATETGRVKNTVRVESDNYPVNEQQRWTIINALLSISDITDSHDPVQVGETLRYRYQIVLNEQAVDAVTDVQFTAKLPAGTSLVDMHANNGECDGTHYPEVVCHLAGLSPGNGTYVDIDIQVEEPRLLKLITTGTVEAEGYPTHVLRERTTIQTDKVDYGVDYAVVIDTTSSMVEERADIVTAIDSFMEANPDFNEKVALIEFKDHVEWRLVTRDLRNLRRVVNNLKIEGGGTCPEASVAALNTALNHLKDGGTIIFLTDASPYKDADIEALKKRIEDKEVIFEAYITGDCGSVNDFNIID